MDPSTPWQVVFEVPCPSLALGPHRFDIRHRALVMGILNRTPDSFFDQGSYYDFDAFLAKAEQLVAEGADFLDVGGVKAGPGPEVAEAEELERVIPALEALRARFDVPALRRHLAGIGAARRARGRRGRRQRHQRVRRPRLPRRWPRPPGRRWWPPTSGIGPRVPDPEPVYDEPVVDAVARFLRDRAEQAEAAGIPRERIMVDAGLDLGKTEPQSLELLRAHDRLAALGWPLFLSASNKRFLGHLRRHRRRRSARGQPRRPRPRHRARAAASCGPTTCAAPAAPPT